MVNERCVPNAACLRTRQLLHPKFSVKKPHLWLSALALLSILCYSSRAGIADSFDLRRNL